MRSPASRAARHRLVGLRALYLYDVDTFKASVGTMVQFSHLQESLVILSASDLMRARTVALIFGVLPRDGGSGGNTLNEFDPPASGTARPPPDFGRLVTSGTARPPLDFGRLVTSILQKGARPEGGAGLRRWWWWWWWCVGGPAGPSKRSTLSVIDRRPKFGFWGLFLIKCICRHSSVYLAVGEVLAGGRVSG